MLRRAYELQLPLVDDVNVEWLVPDIGRRLTEVRAPTLVVVGEEDVQDVHQLAERLVRAIPGARSAAIPGAAHVPSLERPREFNGLVLEFLRHAGVRPGVRPRV